MNKYDKCKSTKARWEGVVWYKMTLMKCDIVVVLHKYNLAKINDFV